MPHGILFIAYPLGFVAYYPALCLLNKATIPIRIQLPAIASCILIIGSMLWRKGIKRYNSTGT
ncbi:ABC-2 family transporter protein [Lacrimispora sp.]|uniref:ABC-2 family transporter protein n=1 Tax=Lacrimispora sp. TaxID=2719234 RepID=UPI003FA54196